MAKLIYFNGRGRGEIVRLTLAAAGIEFTEDLITEREHYLKLINEDKLLFGQVPVLEIDGKVLAQTNSIVRYIGRKAGLTGKNEDEAVLIDTYFEGGRDFMSASYPIMFLPEDQVLDGIKKTSLPKYLPIFEKIAAATGTGFLVGDSLTVADISLLEPLLVYVEYFGKEILNDYPAVQKFYDTVSSLDRIAAFLKGPQRKQKNDQRYIDEVKRSLARVF